jgi:hypothetical protein
MKNIVYLFLLTLTVLSCRKDDKIPVTEFGFSAEEAVSRAQSVCGAKNMPWLNEIISKAEEDKKDRTHKGNYIGSVSIIEDRGKSLFLVNMAMGSGGILVWIYDCSGNQVKVDHPEKFSDPKSNRKALYSTHHF